MKNLRSAMRGYAVALVAVGLAVALTFALGFTLGRRFTGYGFLYLIAIAAAAWRGYGPGILATLVSFFLVPRLFVHSFTAGNVDFGRFVPVLLVSALISLIAANRGRVEEALRKANEELDERVRQRTAELQRANAALQESEQRFALFMQHLSGAAWMKDLQGRYVYANPTGERIFHVKLQQLRGKTDEEIFPPEIASQFKENDRRALSGGGNLQTIEILPQEDGPHYSVVSKFPILGPDDSPMMVGGVAIDITDRLKAEEQAHDRLAELEQLYKTAPTGLALVDAQSRFVRVNEQLAAINGVPVSAHFGRTLQEILPPWLANIVEPLYRQVLESGMPILQREIHGASPAQTAVERDWLASFSPVKAEDGRILGVQVLMHDITERKRFDERLRHTAKLESLGVLAGGVAHDFNNLLTGILGNASLALDTIAPENPARSMLQDVMIASERAAGLTRQLLAYAGKGRFVIEPLNLSTLVREISHLIRSSIPKTVQLRLNLQDQLPPIAADASQIQQVVMNLVINGAEAIPEGESGTVLVTSGIQDVDEAYLQSTLAPSEPIPVGRYVFLEVHDTGSGMEPGTIERIFDPFFTTKFTGRGLGLAAVMGIVHGHNGALKVYSTPGKGSTFKVLFPSMEEQTVPNPPAPAGAAAQKTALVLVIDDEEIVRRTAQSTLQRYGYKVVTAENGSEGLALFERHASEIGLVILDLTMPGLDGEDAFRQLKQIRPDVKVILSSGYNEVEIVQRFTGKGLAGFIQKPYTAAALVNKVNEVLSPHARPV